MHSFHSSILKTLSDVVCYYFDHERENGLWPRKLPCYHQYIKKKKKEDCFSLHGNVHIIYCFVHNSDTQKNAHTCVHTNCTSCPLLPFVLHSLLNNSNNSTTLNPIITTFRYPILNLT